MNIIQSPDYLSFSADTKDYIIDTREVGDPKGRPVRLFVHKGTQGGPTVIDETYEPDAECKVYTHRLGQACAAFCSSAWPSGNVMLQPELKVQFTLQVGGTIDRTITVYPSRWRSDEGPGSSMKAMTLAKVKYVTANSREWITAMFAPGDRLRVWAMDVNGTSHDLELCNPGNSVQAVYTVDVSYSVVSLLCHADLRYYIVGQQTFTVVPGAGPDVHYLRFMNNFECPEGLTATGGMTLKQSTRSEQIRIDGVDSRGHIENTGEYTLKSGPLYAHSDYAVWEDLAASGRVQLAHRGRWIDVIITKTKIERSFRLDKLGEVEVTFRMADPQERILI